MSDNGHPLSLSPFPRGYRASGVLLHVTSLPSPYGIGDLGPTALAWVDRLHEAGQSWWQALPQGPTGYGNSPYQPLSSFAGNWLLISPERLMAEGLLLRLAWSSVAALALAPLQDLLNLGADGRMNVPGRVDGNWRWRCTETMLSTSSSFEWLCDLTKSSNRSPVHQSAQFCLETKETAK